VVDDGSGPEADGVLAALADLGAMIIRLESNSGIAAALNTGLRVALHDPEIRAVLTMDQDSTLPDGFASSAVAALDRLESAGVGIVVPAKVAGNLVPTHGRFPTGDVMPLEPIQSGMLISRTTFDAVGWFRSELVIDCVDTEFFLRARRAGFFTVVNPGSSIGHSLGHTTITAPTRKGVSLHSPLRRYYITRNRMTILREYRRSHPAWFWYSLRKEIVGFLLTLALGRDRRAQVLAAYHGFRAFRLVQYGQIPTEVRTRIESVGR
jgi:rhamnosyltransferase